MPVFEETDVEEFHLELRIHPYVSLLAFRRHVKALEPDFPFAEEDLEFIAPRDVAPSGFGEAPEAAEEYQ
jgi:hypothetical protein